MLEFIKGNRGNNKLIHKSFAFLKDGKGKDVEYWKCEFFRRFKCKARVHTDNENIVKEVNEHNHSRDVVNIDVKRVIEEVKREARDTSDTPSQIIKKISLNVSDEVAGQLPSVTLLKKAINRVRKPTDLPTVTSTEDLNLPENYKVTEKNEPFLMADSGKDTQRILIFSTQKNLDLLKCQDTWFCDGTFNVAPTIFKQLVTIHISTGGYIIPLVYVLLSDKKEKTYTKILKCIKVLIGGNCPKFVMTDFENGLMNSFLTVFPETTQLGCFFHFNQCIYRKILGN